MHTLNNVCKFKTELVDYLDSRAKEVNGIEHVGEADQVVDMIKDLAQVEKDCWETCYYKKVIAAMDEHDFDSASDIEAEGRMGYDNRRYANGQYAPKGHGHYSPVHGFTPDRMGYPTSQTGTSRHATTDRMGYIPDPALDPSYTHAYEDYKDAKRYYTETRDHNEKSKMDHYAKEHVDESLMSFREIWGDADLEMKKDMKGKLNKLLAEMQM